MYFKEFSIKNDAILNKLILFIILLTSMSCSTNEILTPMQPTQIEEEKHYSKEVPTSDITLTYEISKKAMGKYLNEVLDSIFSEKFEFPDQNIEVHVSRMKTGTIEVSDKEVLTMIPIYLDIDKSTMIGNLSAFGEMELQVVSKLNISPDWEMGTATEVVDYNWTVAPKVKLGPIDIPIQTITDNIIDRIKPLIEQNIDLGISENFSLKDNITSLGQVLFTPYQLDSTTGGWIKMKADSVHMSSWTNIENYSTGKIYTKMTMIMDSNPRDTLDMHIIPPFSWKEDISDLSTFRLWADLSYDYLTKIVQSNFLNQTFKSGTKSVKVEAVEISGDRDQLIVQARTSGSFNGIITISGQPHYEDGILRVQNILWDIRTNNLLHKAATWIKKGFIHDQLNNMLVFDLAAYLETAKGEIYNYLGELKKSSDIDVLIDWGQIDLSNIRTQDEGLEALMKADLKVHVIIDDIEFINSFKE